MNHLKEYVEISLKDTTKIPTKESIEPSWSQYFKELYKDFLKAYKDCFKGIYGDFSE